MPNIFNDLIITVKTLIVIVSFDKHVLFSVYFFYLSIINNKLYKAELAIVSNSNFKFIPDATYLGSKIIPPTMGK